jgi:hypothetical protein
MEGRKKEVEGEEMSKERKKERKKKGRTGKTKQRNVILN